MRIKHELRKVLDLEIIWMLEVLQKSSRIVLILISGDECYVGENSPLTLTVAGIWAPEFACAHHGPKAAVTSGV